MANEVAIDVCDLEVRFPSNQTALHKFNLQIPFGSITSIVGPSGCGKSTLLRCIASLTTPTDGRVKLDASLDPSRRAFVFQSSNLLPWRDVFSNVGLPLELRGVHVSERDKKIEAVLEMVDLNSADRHKFPHMLSGGMQMRVSLARALITQPQVLLLDEPFAALDDILRQELNEQLLRIWRHEKWTTVFVTHNVTEAVFLSQRVVVLSKSPGTIAAEIDIPFGYPRAFELKSTAEFAKICGHVSATLKEAAR